uniref:hypothetical protein n=1 Tax=Streptosporangium sp. CA-235898 TaxID=3240073 RepID=UPI003F4987D2
MTTDIPACPVCSLIDLPHRPVRHLRVWARSIVFSAYGGNTHPLSRLALALVVDRAFGRIDKLRAKRGKRRA